MIRMLKVLGRRLKPAATSAARSALVLMLLITPARTSAQPQPPKDFIPVDETAPEDRIPALPLIAGAYGFIWVVMLGYVWSIGRRLQKVEGELAELEARRK